LAWVFTADCPYDHIANWDLLSKIAMPFDFTEMMVTTFRTTTTMKPKHFYANPFAALLDIIHDHKGNLEEEISNSFAAMHLKTVTELHYEKVDINEVVKPQKHLLDEQRTKFLAIL
jgi:hypothetical protein